MAILNVNLGTPYEAIIRKAITKGYAGNQSEVIRQALKVYDEYLEAEEMRLVAMGVEEIMDKVESGEIKTHDLDEVLNREDKRRELYEKNHNRSSIRRSKSDG